MRRIIDSWMRLPVIGKIAIVAGIIAAVAIILVLTTGPRWPLGGEIPYP